MHRCARITAKVQTIPMVHLTEHLTTPQLNPLMGYCVNRLLTHSDLRNPESWTVNTCRGYYGEEISSVTLDSGLAVSMTQALTDLMKSKNPVHDALIAEYGYLLDVLKPLKQWTIESVDVKKILLPGTSSVYTTRLDQSTIARYMSNWPTKWPVGVAVVTYGAFFENGKAYRLIDGQHRFAAQARKTSRTVKLLVGR
jgi:hypothetical protein